MNINLKPVVPKKISDQVFDQLRELLFRGRIKPGEKLLPEREMARAMNVSRSTVRTAIHRLVDMGLVVHRQGQGTFARDYQDELKNPIARAIKAQDISLETLLEIRLPLECNAAALAAKRADYRDIKAIKNSFEEMVREHDRGRTGSQADASFHMAIAYASKNPLHIMIIYEFYDYIFHSIRESLEAVYKSEENLQDIFLQHERILKAIESRDTKTAYESMDAHISFLMVFIRAGRTAPDSRDADRRRTANH